MLSRIDLKNGDLIYDKLYHTWGLILNNHTIFWSSRSNFQMYDDGTSINYYLGKYCTIVTKIFRGELDDLSG